MDLSRFTTVVEQGAAPTVPDFSRFTQVVEEPQGTFSEYLQSLGGDLTKETIMQDPRLMGTVRENLRTRFGDRSLIAGAATGLLGGATASYTDDLSDEEAFEIWQNYHRSFAGGQTVTTANELAYITKADDTTKAKMAEGYELFDSMGNIFTGEGTWSETFDGVRDYVMAGVWDPTTVASFGVGRLWAQGGSKAAATGIKEAARLTARQVAREQLQAGATRQVAQQAAQQAASIAGRKALLGIGQQAVAYSAVDMAASGLADAGYQVVMKDVGLQDTWNYGQSALATVGAVAVPAMVYGGKMTVQGVQALTANNPALARVFESYKGIKAATAGKGPNTITKAVKSRVDLTRVNESLRNSFADFDAMKDSMWGWEAAKETSREVMEAEGINPGVLDPINPFFNRFLFGSEETGLGLVPEAAKAGFVYVERSSDDKITNWVGDMISWLDEDVVESALKGFDSANGTNLYEQVLGATGDNLQSKLASVWKVTGSAAGYRLVLSKKAGDFLGADSKLAAALIDEIEGKPKTKLKDAPAPFHYLQSVWKRLMTSHPGTTGANIKGWYMMSLANTVSDFALGVTNYGQAAAFGLSGRASDAKRFLTMGNGAILSSVRRGFHMLDPEATLKEAEEFFKANPKVAEEIFRELSGDVGAKDAPTRFRMTREVTVNGKKVQQPLPGIDSAEKFVRGAQSISGVMLQDEITKQLSFMANLDRALLRSYGKTYAEFMQQADSFVEMRSTKFSDAVAQATDRTLRETASKSWSGGTSGWFTKRAANAIEDISNDPIAGYAIPFGRFFNTSIAFFGDFTMLNFVNYSLKKTFNKAAIDPLTEEGADLFAKGVVGLSALYLMSDTAMDKIEQGLAWYQEVDDDGSVKDITYDFPESYMRGVAQMIGHWRKDGTVPNDLSAEIGTLVIGQTFRAGQEGIQAATNLYFDMTSGDLQLGAESALEAMKAFGINIASGATRPLDPVNQFAKMLSDEGGTADRRQGYEALRYIDSIPSLWGQDVERPLRATPTRGKDLPTDMGRVLGGVRESQQPNPTERVFNSIGTASWREVRWDGDPIVKNRLDELIDPIINTRMMAMLDRNPDFFDMSLEHRQRVVAIEVEAAKKEAREILKMGMNGDSTLDVLHQINTQNKAVVRKSLERLGMDATPEEIAMMPGGKEMLDTLLYFIKNYDEMLELDIE